MVDTVQEQLQARHMNADESQFSVSRRASKSKFLSVISQRPLKVMMMAGLAALSLIPAYGQYTADVNTGGAQRLFLDAAFTTPAPVGSTLWFVADVTGDGLLGISGGSAFDTYIQSIANSTGDDKLVKSGLITGGFVGAGKFSAAFTGIDSSFGSKNIYVVLWNDVNANRVIGDVGDKFGTLNLGVRTPPEFGNASWVIGSNINASQNTVTPVPEPANPLIKKIDVASGGAIAETGSSFTFNVSGLSADVSSVKLRLAFFYSFLEDLNISLTSPGGVKSVAVLGRGATFQGTEFRDVVFSDSGSVFPSGSIGVSFSGTYRTQTGQNLSSGPSSFNGLTPAQANGAWILRFTDVNQGDGDKGTLYKGVTAPWGGLGTQLEITSAPLIESLVVDVNAQASGVQFTNVSGVRIELRSTFLNAAIFYTLDGSQPSPASTPYTGTFVVSNSVVLRAIAFNPVDFSSVESGPIPISMLKAFHLTTVPALGGRIALTPAGGFYTNGTVVTLAPRPDAGWVFVRWSGDAEGTSTNIALVMDRDKAVSASFRQLLSFGLDIMVVGGGFIAGAAQTNYWEGSVATVTAIPQPGWIFQRWGADASGDSTNLSLLMNGNKRVIAYFQGITLASAAGGGGTIAGNTQSLYLQNSVVNLTATANPGWEFLSWAGDVIDTNAAVSLSMTGPKEVQAVFGTSLSVSVIGRGSVTMNGMSNAIPWGSVVRLAAIPEPGYYFALWGLAASGIANPLDFTVTIGNSTVGALFLPLESNQITLNVREEGVGRVVRVPDVNVYTNGQTVTLIAQPGFDQDFTGWTGVINSAQNPLTVTLVGSQTLTANFTHRAALGIQQSRTAVGGPTERSVLVRVAGPIGNQYLLQMSRDLATWSPFARIVISSGEAQFVHTLATNTPWRFFRAVQLP